MSNSLRPHGLFSPWNSPGQNTGGGSLSLLQGIFPTQELNPGLLHCRWLLYQLNHKGSPRILECVAYPFSRGSSWLRNQTRISCIAGDLDSIPGLGRSLGEGKGYPLQYSGLENSMDWIVHGVSKSWTWWGFKELEMMSNFPFYPIDSLDFHAAAGHGSLHPDSFLSMLFCHRACSRAGEVHSVWQRYGLEVPQVTISSSSLQPMCARCW